jgi:MOSC domain-containing protein
MLFELDGAGAHEEDTWTTFRVGEARVRVAGPVPRCAVTTQDPDTGVRTLDTLRAITSYRGLRDGGKIDFGVYLDVVEPGRVRLGDAVVPD